MSENAKILIIEDDQDLVEVMKIILEKEGYSIDFSYDPVDGLAKVKEGKPNLVILDVMFASEEKIKGFDTAVEIRKDKDI